MGAAAGKAVEDLASAAAGTTTRAEDRLAVAERVILEFERRRSSCDGSDVGIWDAQATCTNSGLLAAVDEIVFLKEMHELPMASAAGRRMDGALRAAMSCLMEEFLSLRVWDGSQLEGRSGLRFAVHKLSVSVAAARGASSSFAFLTGGSTASTVRSRTSMAELSSGTVDELYASGSQPAGPDVFSDGEFPDDLALICPASLSVLHEISLRVIRAGYTKELLHTFADAPCEVLDRFLSILQLQVGCSQETETDESVSYENAEWWTAEDMIRRWILATKLVGKALVTMQTQLHAQSNGAFDRFKNDYLMAMAKRRSYILLRFADGFTSTRSPEKLMYVLEMYEVLSSSAPGLVLVLIGPHKELFSRQVEVVLAKLARALRVMIGGAVTKVRTGGSSGTQSETRGVGAAVHPLTRYAVSCIESLAPQRGALDVILASTGGSLEGVNSFGDLFSELVASLEPKLEEISALRGAEGGGLRHLFLANNTSFVLKRAGALGGDEEWAACRRSRVEQHVAGYVEASWAPVVACLEAGKPATKALAKFNAALEKAYSGHVRCEVADPELRAALRKAVSEKIVGAYGAYLLEHSKLGKSARYTPDSLAGLVSELFEGEDAAGSHS
ncbi:hypothetical protein ACQJBY_063757 [Aegilops geniculata]